MNDIFNIIDGDRGINYPKITDFTTSCYLNAGNITNSGFDFDNNVFISQEKHSQLRKGKLAINDIVLITRGTVDNSLIFQKYSIYIIYII